MKFTEITIKGYRSMVDVTMPLRPLTVMIGPNGSGKTSLLEIFRLLKKAMGEKLAEGITDIGGLASSLSHTTTIKAEHLRLALEVDVEDHKSDKPMHYQVELALKGTNFYNIAFEQLSRQLDPHKPYPFYYLQVNSAGVRYKDPNTDSSWETPNWVYKENELALAQVPRMYREPEALRDVLTQTRFFGALDVSRRAPIRLPQSLTPTLDPGPNGEDLYSALYTLRTEHRTSYKRILEVLELAFPGFEDLDFPLVGGMGNANLAWYDEELSRPIYASELSEGTLRFLWLATILLNPTPPPLTLIDEPEISLHPELLQILAGLLQDAAVRGQVVVATHAADLIRWLEPEEVVIMDKESGQTHATWANTLDLTHWLDEYTLAELWLTGVLGGRP